VRSNQHTEGTGKMFGLRWFGPKRIGTGIGPRTWQARAAVVLGLVAILAVSLAPIPPPIRHQLKAVILGLLIVTMLLTYSAE
jgi:hypothetical protein